MSIDATSERPSRRALLAGALAAATASVVAALGRPRPAGATNGGSVILGITPTTPLDGSGANEATGSTGIYTTGNIGLEAQSASTNGIGLSGYATSWTGSTKGILGTTASSSGIGVWGQASAALGNNGGVYGESNSPDGYGVYGRGDANTGGAHGVRGISDGPTGIGTVGQSWADATGVLGFSGAFGAATPAGKAKTGVYGEAVQDADARGVWGRSAAGRGVYGQASTGHGVHGYSATGAAGYFVTSEPTKGAALRAVGRVRFDHCVGVATVNATASSVTVTPGIDLTATSAVVATLMGNAGGSTTVKRVTVDAVADTFTIVLTAATSANVKVAWHAFG